MEVGHLDHYIVGKLGSPLGILKMKTREHYLSVRSAINIF